MNFLADATIVICFLGMFASVCFGFYHQWSRRGSYGGLLTSALAFGIMFGLAALIIRWSDWR